MTNQLQDTTFIPRDYDIFGGLDVDKKGMSNQTESLTFDRVPGYYRFSVTA